MTVYTGNADGRWRMGRVGILNFWHYDEEVFELEDGRLILRGANGSGKSVTMQSFLPLVLDGDKRPHRLDPFGSRDRRIEYYLLGEPDSGKTDVTGYLWMEFVHPARGLTKTIGIGLRARRGAAQVQFWGFLLDDGRRIGIDFWLYDRNHWLEHHTRIPLGRQELEKAIGAGGQVVHDQASYRDLVNRQLFGFADAESYQDLLHLMIQLRSPKLSKEFKPSAIYDILHSALPPLQEDELRPLSEVLEDMDQIADRLDELRLHMRELGRLQETYERYNRRTLYDESARLLEASAEHRGQETRLRESEANLKQAEEDKRAAMADISRLEAAIGQAESELDVLENHEAIGKQRELEAAAAALADAEKHLELAHERLRRNRDRLLAVERDLEEAELHRGRLRAEQQELLKELESIAQEIEFADHAVHHRLWGRGEPADDVWREPWRRDLKRHRERLEMALAKAREEQAAARAVRELEADLGEARKGRDERERERNECARALEEGKDALRETIVMWRDALVELPFGEDRVRETFEAVSAFGVNTRSAEAIRAPMREALAARREQLAAERLRLEHERRMLELERERLAEEKRTWEAEREPEPPRGDARARRRERCAPGSGAPLYAACDFRADVDDARRARIEEALERAGLLDAWISPDGRIGAAGDDEEEAWIVPQPIEFGYTLADVLVPSPPAESGLSNETIDAVLRTVLWVDDGGAYGLDAQGAALSGAGAWRIGPLAGQTAGKARAEYIGKETRRRTRLLEIARLQRELEALAERIADLDRGLADLSARERQAIEESGGFPDTANLEQRLQDLNDAASRLEAALGQEHRALERFKAKSAEWRELQRELTELTQSWSRLKRERDLEEALAAARDYEAALSDLHSAWRRQADLERRTDDLRHARQAAEDAIGQDEQLTDELEDRRRVLRAQVDALRRLMDDLGLADISRRIETLKRERERLLLERKAASARLADATEAAGKAAASVELVREREAECRRLLEDALERWRREIGRRLLDEWRDAAAEAASAGAERAAELAHAIRHRYDAAFSGRNADTVKNTLLEQFNEVRSVLTDYVLELDIEEDTGRIVLASKRDRAHPQPPSLLLEELKRDEEQQSALLSEKDRELYEEIILRSVGKAIRQRIHRAESWVDRMNRLMEERNTSSGLRLKLEWREKAAANEQQLDTAVLVELLKRDAHRLREDEIDAMIRHFRSQIGYAKQNALSEKESLRKHLYEVLDYRNWFQFELKYRKGEQTGYRPLTDSRFNVLSGGEKAMAMYIPLFAAAWSRYSDARPDAPRIISLDEAFAGVDEENMRDMFQLLTEMGFDYMMTSQVLWGCYDTVPRLAIYEIHRPKDADFITLFRYRWNGRVREYVPDEADAS